MKLTIKQTDDLIIVDLKKWFLHKIFFKKGQEYDPYYSQVYDISFNKFSDYWMELGKRNALIEIIHTPKNNVKSYSTPEILEKLAMLEFGPQGIGVIMFNIDMQNLGRLMDRVQFNKLHLFAEDFVFIKTESRTAAKKVMDRIPPEMASAVAVNCGSIFEVNDIEIYERI